MNVRLPLLFAGLTLVLNANASSVDDIIKERYDHLESFYQDLHRHPELSLKETRTAAKMADEMNRLGLETFENVGGGVIGVFRNGNGPVTMLRAELDALPVTEDTGLPYSSEVPGVAHSCGHDLHMTTIIGAADVMIREKAKWRGTLVLVGQPAEEVLKGAQAMIDAGLFNIFFPKPDHIIAIHTRGALDTGKVAFLAGPAQASNNTMDVFIRGVSTHAAAPFRGVDATIVASEFVLAMQTLIGREVDPLSPAVITVGSIHGGTKHNIVADEVKLQMTMRTFDTAVKDHLLLRIDEIAKSLSKAANAPDPTVTIVQSTPVLVNEPNLTARFRAAVTAELGAEVVVDSPLHMTSDDFALYGPSIGVPAVKYNLGSSSSTGKVIDNHSPKFAPNVKVVLPLGIKSVVAGLLDLHK